MSPVYLLHSLVVHRVGKSHVYVLLTSFSCSVQGREITCLRFTQLILLQCIGQRSHLSSVYLPHCLVVYRVEKSHVSGLLSSFSCSVDCREFTCLRFTQLILLQCRGQRSHRSPVYLGHSLVVYRVEKSQVSGLLTSFSCSVQGREVTCLRFTYLILLQCIGQINHMSPVYLPHSLVVYRIEK